MNGTAGREVRQLNALEHATPKSPRPTNAALAQATESWKQMGITKSQLSPVNVDHMVELRTQATTAFDAIGPGTFWFSYADRF